MVYYLSNAERKGTESVVDGGFFFFLMKMDSKIRNSMVFLDVRHVPIVLKWSELIHWLLLQITALSLKLGVVSIKVTNIYSSFIADDARYMAKRPVVLK